MPPRIRLVFAPLSLVLFLLTGRLAYRGERER
jgi:hypothetical protein